MLQAKNGPTPGKSPLDRGAGCRQYGVEVLRGQGQVVFLSSVPAGALLTVALFAAGWEYGLYAIAGTALGTATSRLLGADRERVSTGLEGFNACLTALCFAVFLGADHLSTALLAAVGCVVVTVVTAAVVNLLGVWHLPSLTLPYCLLATAMTTAAPGFARIWHHGEGLAALTSAATGPTSLGFSDLWHGFFAGFAEIFFMPQWYVGALVLAALLVASRRAAAVACVGSLAGILSAWALGAPVARIADGTMGYNAILVALALCGVFLEAGPRTLGYAAVGAFTATAATPAMAALFAPSGGHTFTWPFLLTTFAFLAAARSFPGLRTSAPAPAVPEPTTAGALSAQPPAPQAP
ncbi:urea transporter [Streptomyces sp. NPDC001939]|uniref:urea transporter n=5 Tax=Streptomyces TaxID=1883 RepID=UPI001D0B66A3|nr:MULTISPECIES: urea transporter [Streptomyces]MCX5080708.1 urea transporter [Streptomyces sp. NBC_00401]UDL98937.1 urea transporter [Streptomyces longhuiensis]